MCTALANPDRIIETVNTGPRKRADGPPPLGIGRLWRGICGGVSRLSLLLQLQYRRVSVFAHLRWFRFYFLGFAFVVGSYRLLRWFRVVRFMVSLLMLVPLFRCGFLFAFSYSGAPYGDRSAELTMF